MFILLSQHYQGTLFSVTCSVEYLVDDMKYCVQENLK